MAKQKLINLYENRINKKKVIRSRNVESIDGIKRGKGYFFVTRGDWFTYKKFTGMENDHLG